MTQESGPKSSILVKERKRAARVAKVERASTGDGAGDSIGPVEVLPLGSKGRARKPGRRGPQKLPTKVAVTVRYSQEVLEHFKATGDGWQTRMNDALRHYVDERRQHQEQDQAA